MSYFLGLKCAMDCKTPPLESEQLSISDPPPRDFPGRAMGEIVINYGAGHMEDLVIAARKAGWHWDGTRWLCGECVKEAEQDLARAYDAACKTVGQMTDEGIPIDANDERFIRFLESVSA